MRKLNLFQPMEAKKEIFQKLSKIWSIINNMAQERRINSEELDDFNQAYRKLNNLVDTILQTVEMMEKEALEIEQLKMQHLANRHKMELCMELCGMSKIGIKHMMNFQIAFLEMAFSLRFKKGKPLETDYDFYWLDQLWKSVNTQIENDFDSFNEAKLFKRLHLKATSPEVKKSTLKAMNVYVQDLSYLKSKLGKDIDRDELLNAITNHWYEEYRNCTTPEIS